MSKLVRKQAAFISSLLDMLEEKKDSRRPEPVTRPSALSRLKSALTGGGSSGSDEKTSAVPEEGREEKKSTMSTSTAL